MMDGCDTTIKQSGYGYGNHPFATRKRVHVRPHWRPNESLSPISASINDPPQVHQLTNPNTHKL